jgi:hypothetical protein
MPIRLELTENGHVMYWHLEYPWTIEELTKLYPLARKYLDEATFTLHSLVDATAIKTVPANTLQARQTSTWKHPRSGHTVVITTSNFVSSMVSAIFRLARFEKIKFVQTEADGLSYLRPLIAQETVGEQAL